MKLIISQWLCSCCEVTVVPLLQIPSQEDAARPLQSNQPSCVPMEGDTRPQNAWYVALIGWRLVLTRLGSWSYHGNWPRVEVTSLCPELPLCLWFELPPFVKRETQSWTDSEFSPDLLYTRDWCPSGVYMCHCIYSESVFFFFFFYSRVTCKYWSKHHMTVQRWRSIVSSAQLSLFSVLPICFSFGQCFGLFGQCFGIS